MHLNQRADIDLVCTRGLKVEIILVQSGSLKETTPKESCLRIFFFYPNCSTARIIQTTVFILWESFFSGTIVIIRIFLVALRVVFFPPFLS